MSRLTILPDPRVEPLTAGIQARLTHIAGLINADNFADLLTPLATALLLDAFERVGAHEGTVWLADPAGRCLIPAFNNGPNAAELRRHRQPLDKGFTSMVFANEQPFVMNRDRAGMDPTLMDRLKLRITSQIIVPLYFLGECRGVVSCVQIARGDEPEAAGFEAEALRPVKRATDALRVIIDSVCLARTIGVTL